MFTLPSISTIVLYVATILIAGSCVTLPPRDDLITLSWDSNKEPVDGYIIFVGVMREAGEMTKLKTVEACRGSTQKATYTIDELGIARGRSVCFRVKAYMGDLISDYSEAVCATF